MCSNWDKTSLSGEKKKTVLGMKILCPSKSKNKKRCVRYQEIF
jgi:hypothetical protein